MRPGVGEGPHHDHGPDPRERSLVAPQDGIIGIEPAGVLAGVGVAFKLVHALMGGEEFSPFLASQLDLVALGTVVDVVSLVGENRILVRRGLTLFADREGIRPGLAALLAVADLDSSFPVNASDLAFQIAPRLNACGIGRGTFYG